MTGSFLVRVSALLVLMSALATSTVRAQDIHPAQQSLTDWLAIINAGDVNDLGQFIAENYSEAALSAIPAEIRTSVESDMMRSRPWIMHSFEARSETQGSALLYSELTEVWAQVEIEVGADAPHSIEMLGMRPAQAPADAASQPVLTDEDLPAYLNDYLARLADAGLFSGTVLIAHEGQVLYEGAFGLANRDSATPNQIDTKFNLGSMNKMVTAVAIAQLVERGLIEFDDLISEYLPNLPEDIASRVTIEQLLTHTSGLAEFFASPDWAAYQDNLDTISGYFPLFIDQPLQFEPGSQHRYSNSNFIVLGAIIEAVTGEDYFAYVNQHIYLPAGMTNTDAYRRDADVPNLAIGYTSSDANGRPTPGEQRANTPLLPMRGSPAGGGYSTVNDMYRFAEALRNGTLLSPEMVENLLEGKVDTGIAPASRYAYGFIDQLVNGSRIVGHGGGFPGVNGNLDIYLDEGYTVVVLSNIDMGAMTVNNRLRELLTSN
jgi:CubicO group peptidase (beta-lactamase class C family)